MVAGGQIGVVIGGDPDGDLLQPAVAGVNGVHRLTRRFERAASLRQMARVMGAGDLLAEQAREKERFQFTRPVFSKSGFR